MRLNLEIIFVEGRTTGEEFKFSLGGYSYLVYRFVSEEMSECI